MSIGSSNVSRNRVPRPTPESDTHRRSILSAVWRPPALGVILALAPLLAVFYNILDVVGGTGLFLLEVGAVLAIASWIGGRLRERTALMVAAVALIGALLVYVYSLPPSQRALFTIDSVLGDTAALLTGLSILRILKVGVWALALAPVPTFLSWYLLVRGRYVGGSVVAAGALGFFVLTGDAGTGLTLVTAVGVTLAAGLTGLDAAGLRGVEAQWDTLAVIVTAMILVTATVSIVPGSASGPLDVGGPAPTVEGSLVSNTDRLSVVGSLRLSPDVRFVVEAEQAAYWRTGTYDRYTGNGWVRTGNAQPLDGNLEGPPGESRELEQTVTAKTKLNTLPAAWKPVSVEGDIARTVQRTDHDGLKPGATIQVNESYTVTSERPLYTTAQLRRAGTDYPSSIQNRYTQLPESTPDRIGERTQRILQQADATNPYEAAVAIERYLERTKEYSLTVDRPQGNIADSFLFEMDAGYCTYFATTMIVMLRSQGIPARFVTGYTPGQRVAEDKWVVRGLDAHAWVEVYFPGIGWVQFDPTPSGPRSATEQARIEEARAEGEEGVDAAGSADGTYTTSTATPGEDGTGPVGETPNPLGPEILDQNESQINGTAGLGTFEFGTETATGGVDGNGDSGDDSPLPSQRTIGLGVVALVGMVAGARRFGVMDRAYRAVWLLYQPKADPGADVQRAFHRLEYLAERRYRPRSPGETPREYVDRLVTSGLNPRARELARTYERARYGRGVTRDEADEMLETVNELVRHNIPIVGRITGQRAS